MKRCAAKPYMGSEKYIFVSYCHKDAKFAFPIIEQMAKSGYRIWYDEGIDPGTEWPETIAQHLNASAACIALISENAVNSHNCRREINFALLKKKPLLSVMLHEVPLSLGMEMQLSATQAIFKYKLSEEEFFEKLYGSAVIEGCCGEKQEDIRVSSPEEYEMPDAGAKSVGCAESFKDTWFRSDELSPKEAATENAKQKRTSRKKRSASKEKKSSTVVEKAAADGNDDVPTKIVGASTPKKRATVPKKSELTQGAEEQARREAEEQARREAEEQARREAEERAHREAEEQARRAAEEQARREAEERVRREAEERIYREVEEHIRREAEERARREIEERARREAEQRIRREAEEQVRREIEERARWEVEDRIRREEFFRREYDRAIMSARRELATAEGQDKTMLLDDASCHYARELQNAGGSRSWLIRLKNGERIDLREGETRIGRARDVNDYVIDDNSAVGRRHATIIRRDGMCVLVDHHSANGSFINSRRIEPGKEYLLANGYNLRIANEKFSFFQTEGKAGK